MQQTSEYNQKKSRLQNKNKLVVTMGRGKKEGAI